MKTVHCFIFTWNQYYTNAKILEDRLKKYGEVTVINSNVNYTKQHWINLNDAYFPEQWNTLISCFDKNVNFVFHMQADAQYNQFHYLFERFNYVVDKYKTGIYAPNVDFTHHTYPIDKLEKVEDFLYEVPNADETCWFVNTKLIDWNPMFDIAKYKFSYGTDWYYGAKSKLNGYKIIRDYSITIKHPRGTNYNITLANSQYQEWKQEQTDEIKIAMTSLEENRNNLRNAFGT
jgi:hypothetical protein